MRNLKTTTLFASKEKCGCLFVYYQRPFIKHIFHCPRINNTTFSLWKNNFYNVYLIGINKIKLHTLCKQDNWCLFNLITYSNIK